MDLIAPSNVRLSYDVDSCGLCGPKHECFKYQMSFSKLNYYSAAVSVLIVVLAGLPSEPSKLAWVSSSRVTVCFQRGPVQQ